MKTFIRVIEVWTPTEDRTRLTLASGLYGDLHDFKAASEHEQFHYDEGLPGKTWAAGIPLVLTDLEHSYFKRGTAAKAAGLTCGISMPVFAGEFLMAVIVFLCGDDEEHTGAIEVWADDGKDELALVDGYYGTLEHFAWLSKHIRFQRGKGLPGRVWQSGIPIVIDDLGACSSFLRARDALKAGLTTGLGIPCFYKSEKTHVMVMLSAQNTPIAQRFEIWVPDNERLVFNAGRCDLGTDLDDRYRSTGFARGEGLLGRVWQSGLPAVSEQLADDAPLASESKSLSAVLAIPVIEAGCLTAIVSCYF